MLRQKQTKHKAVTVPLS